MERGEVQRSGSRNRARKRSGRRARGLEVTQRDGHWHVVGTIRVNGRSIRLRRSLGLPATSATLDTAWDEVRAIEADARATAIGGKTRGDAVGVAAQAYLFQSRLRCLGPSTVRIIQEVVVAFGLRRLNDIDAKEWKAWIDKRHAKNAAATRERFISTVAAFLRYASDHHGMTATVLFARDKASRNPRRRKVRHVDEMRTDLLARLIQSAHISLQAQIAAKWSTGARVSSIIYSAAVRDVILGTESAWIIFRKTKNGDDVTAALHPTAVRILLEYAKWRGNLHDRDAPFFLTYKRLPYADNGKAWGGQTKTAFNAAKRRARRALLSEAYSAAKALRGQGQRDAALQCLLSARCDARLLRRISPHWFRHLLATRMRPDLRAAMEQGGWRDERSILGYIHDVPKERHALVSSFADIGTFLTPAKIKNGESR